jgi:hypothetical protein
MVLSHIVTFGRVLLVGGEEAEPQLWFYGDRPLRIRVWSIEEFKRRLHDETADLMYDFNVQPLATNLNCARLHGFSLPLIRSAPAAEFGAVFTPLTDSFGQFGCAGVAARCVALPRPAHEAIKIIRISAAFCRPDGLLICGLWVRFPPGSPLFHQHSLTAPSS